LNSSSMFFADVRHAGLAWLLAHLRRYPALVNDF
jgi:hypothetical protein